MSPRANRREFLLSAGACASALVLGGCDGGSSPGALAPPPPTSPTPPANSSPPPTAAPPPPTLPPPPSNPAALKLQEYFRAHASPQLALPAAATDVPTVAWAGPLTGFGSVATTLPDGIVLEASNPLIGRPIRQLLTDSLPANPNVDGFPCLRVHRTYTCKGQARGVGSPNILRLKTDAMVIELSGVVPDDTRSVQTLIVDGRLATTKVLSSSRGFGGGYDRGTIRFEFTTRAMRDLWIETGMFVSYVKVDRSAVVAPIDDPFDPQLTVVGDSYLQASSATFGNGGAIALEMAARLGLRNVAVDSVGGTGYWNSGGDNGNLNERLPAHAADASDIYLVMAGLNDYVDITGGQLSWPSRQTYEDAVTRYLQALRSARPDALIIVTAPFCPVPPMSDSSYVGHAETNTSGLGDHLYRAAVQRAAVQGIAGPWVFIDVLMGGGWLNSSGASGDITGLQWFTGGTPGPGTTATNRPGNTLGGGGGGFGGIARVPIAAAGAYSQAPDVTARGGSGNGLLLAARIDTSGALTAINVVSPGSGYTSGNGLPTIEIDTTFQIEPTTLDTPELLVGVNPDGQYPLAAFAPAGVPTDALNNIYRLLSSDMVHPSPVGVEYISSRLAANTYAAVMAL